MPEKGKEPLPEEESAVLDKLARKVVEKGMTVPAILFLESVKPLNFIGSQAMVFFEPIVQTVFNIKDYDTLRQALEKRQTIEILLNFIHGCCRRSHFHPGWEGQEFVADELDLIGKCRGKEQVLSFRWYHLEKLVELWHETHVEHTVCLIDNKHFDFFKP